MKRLWNQFLNFRFRDKLAISYISLALIPIISLAVLVGTIYLRQIRETAEIHTSQITAQVSNSIDVYISSVDRLAEYVSRFAFGPSEDLQQNLHDLAATHPEIAGILVAFQDDTFISTGMSRISRDPFSSEVWYREAKLRSSGMALISSALGRNIVNNRGYSIDDIFSLTRMISNENGEQAIVLFDIRHDIINDSINNVSIGEQGFVFILDEYDNMVYAPVNSIVYRINPRLLAKQNTIQANILDGTYHIQNIVSSFTGWKTVGVFVLDEIMGGFTTAAFLLIIFTALMAALILFVSILLARTITRPISGLQSLMRRAESGDLTVRFKSFHQDEIGVLGNSFNRMIERIDKLISQVHTEHRIARDAELKILQEQIKPHFLYNTLDTISWMARDYDAKDIVNLVNALTKMFRIGLSHGKDSITLSEEITHVSNYLYIQKTRYKDKLSYQMNIDDGLLPISLPKLILQPLVENAIYHGIKQKSDGGLITISAVKSSDGKYIELMVRDNGAGMEKDVLEKLQEQIEGYVNPYELKSFGLYYISRRLRLAYGEDAKMIIKSKTDEGSSVIILLPCLEDGNV
ncbi:MAG: sensor histidine kinase [Treponema sp.]|nr:sensor histidine kinase [Treponema sp.]